jgi:peptidoglycan/LPS O-acetylase OafA/YrhL
MNIFFSRLSRVTSGGRFVPEIDGLRFVAIASVVLYHLQSYSSAKSNGVFHGFGFLQNGFRGVQLFFVISGFILALPFARHALFGTPKVRLGEYFLRRLTRLEPPYILNLLVSFVFLSAWLASRGQSMRGLLPHLLASICYLHNILYNSKSLINAVAWSLEIEVQFYCLVPLLTFVFFIRNTLLRRSIIILTMGSAVLIQVWLPEYPETIAGQLQFFLAGFLLADVYLVNWSEQPKSHWSWDLLSILGWPFVFLFSSSVAKLAFPFILVVLYCCAFRGTFFRMFFRNPLITTIGGMCYTIYLFHHLVIICVGRFVSSFNLSANPVIYFLTQVVLVIPVVMFVSAAYFILVERPCMAKDWPQKLRSVLRRRWEEFLSPLAARVAHEE